MCIPNIYLTFYKNIILFKTVDRQLKIIIAFQATGIQNINSYFVCFKMLFFRAKPNQPAADIWFWSSSMGMIFEALMMMMSIFEHFWCLIKIELYENKCPCIENPNEAHLVFQWIWKYDSVSEWDKNVDGLIFEYKITDNDLEERIRLEQID